MSCERNLWGMGMPFWFGVTAGTCGPAAIWMQKIEGNRRLYRAFFQFPSGPSDDPPILPYAWFCLDSNHRETDDFGRYWPISQCLSLTVYKLL